MNKVTYEDTPVTHLLQGQALLFGMRGETGEYLTAQSGHRSIPN